MQPKHPAKKLDDKHHGPFVVERIEAFQNLEPNSSISEATIPWAVQLLALEL
jgi:hypothetical protein